MQFSEVKESSVKITHQSVPSLIEINVDGQILLLDYKEFDDLKKTIDKIKEIEKL